MLRGGDNYICGGYAGTTLRITGGRRAIASQLISFLPPNPHPEPVEGLIRLGVSRGDESDKNGPTLTCYVYMFPCSDGSYYVGHTNDLEHRLAAHERGAIEGYTLSRRPVELVFSDQFSTRAGSLPSGKAD